MSKKTKLIDMKLLIIMYFYKIDIYKYNQQLSNLLNISIQSGREYLNKLIELDLVYTQIDGRKKLIFYTKKGIKVFNLIKEYFNIMNAIE